MRKPRRWLAHPVLSVILAAVWLLLQESLAPMQLITAAALGVLLPWAIDPFLGDFPSPRRLATAVRLLAVVLWDIVVSNVAVARLALSPTRKPRSVWLQVPLDIRDERGIAALASIITMTPGTLSTVVDAPGRRIVVHALDAADAVAVAQQIKARYERPLMEIFG